MTDEPRVLAVDDDEDVLETYNIWLYQECTVITATSGREALEKLDEDVDVVLLDRMMSGLSGNQVLDRIHDRDLDCRIVMVTAVDPDFDIVEMDFDAYLPKPMSQEELVDAIQMVHRRSDYPPEIREYLALRDTKETLESTKDLSTLQEHTEYTDLCQQLDELEAEGVLADIEDVDQLV